MDKRIHPRRSNVRIAVHIPAGVEPWARLAPLATAVGYEMLKWIQLGFGDVGIAGEIPVRIE